MQRRRTGHSAGAAGRRIELDRVERGPGQDLSSAAPWGRGGGHSQRAHMASELEPDKTAPSRAHVTNALGMTRFWSGAFEDAESAFAETVSAGEPLGLYAADNLPAGVSRHDLRPAGRGSGGRRADGHSPHARRT